MVQAALLFSPHAGLSQTQQLDFSFPVVAYGEFTPHSLPSTASLVESKSKWVDAASVQTNIASITLPFPDPQQPLDIYYFPASDQPMSEQTMKNMQISLRHTLYSDLSATVSSLANAVQAQDQRIPHVETNMTDLFTVHNKLVDVYTGQLQLIKLAALEDQSHRNNIKFHNIPESGKTELIQYIQTLMHSLAPDLTDRDLEIDGANRLLKPSHLPE